MRLWLLLATSSLKSASHSDILLNIDPNNRLKTILYDKRDDFHFAIVNYPLLCSNIPLSPAYCVYIFPVDSIRKSMACVWGISRRGKLLANKLML
jgi:hypothetical protein